MNDKIDVANLANIDSLNAPTINRYGHSLCMSQDKKIYIFGGLLMNLQNVQNSQKVMYDLQFSDELHVFDLQKNKWIALDVTGKPPLKRHFHSCCVYKNQMFVIGGKSNG